MMILALILVLHILTQDIEAIIGKDCGSYNNLGFEEHLGTKTPYRFRANLNDSQPVYEGCHPIKILGVIRHGTRTPGRKFKSRVENRLKFLRGLAEGVKDVSEACENDRKSLKDWEMTLESEEEKALTHEGEDEMIDLAERFQKRFPSILDAEYSNDTFLFKATDTQRTRQSAFWFTVGLFGRWVSHNRIWFPEPVYKDPILRFYKLCKRWTADVKESGNYVRELEKYKTSLGSVKKTLSAVSSRLNLREPLNYDDLHLMYSTCSFETAWNRFSSSPLCSVLSLDDFQVMEYGEELKYYWRDSYGYEINYAQACPLIQNIFNFLRDTTDFKSVFYFTHSGTLLKLISRLGLYKDEFKLTHDLDDSLKVQRRFRISQIDSFSTNVVFVLYSCGNELKLLTMHQERPVTLPGCPRNDDLCPFNLVAKTLGPFADTCDFDRRCSLD